MELNYNHTDEYAAELTKSDARERSWRTFLQGLGIDIAVGVVLVAATSVTSLEWTQAYWALLGLSLAKSAIQAGVASLMRRLLPPKNL